MRRRIWMALGMTLASSAGRAAAHEGGKHVRGIVKSASAEQLVVHTTDGDVAVRLTPETRVLRSGDAQATPAAGDRAVVHAHSGAGGQLEATEVQLGAARSH